MMEKGTGCTKEKPTAYCIHGGRKSLLTVCLPLLKSSLSTDPFGFCTPRFGCRTKEKRQSTSNVEKNVTHLFASSPFEVIRSSIKVRRHFSANGSNLNELKAAIIYTRVIAYEKESLVFC